MLQVGLMYKLLPILLLFVQVGDLSARDPSQSYMVLAGEQRFRVEVAASPEQRRKGLMHRQKLDDGHGLLMILEQERIIPIWMKNTYIPLNVVWISADGSIVERATLFPCKRAPCPVHIPKSPARFVLEVGAGQFPLKIGDKVEILDASGDSLLPLEPGQIPGDNS